MMWELKSTFVVHICKRIGFFRKTFDLLQNGIQDAVEMKEMVRYCIQPGFSDTCPEAIALFHAHIN